MITLKVCRQRQDRRPTRMRGSRRALARPPDQYAGHPRVIAIAGLHKRPSPSGLVEAIDFDVGFGTQVLHVGLKALGAALLEEISARVLDFHPRHLGGGLFLLDLDDW